MALSKIDSAGIGTGAVTSTALALGVPTRTQMPTGSVVQVVQTSSTTQVSVAGSDVSIGLSASITVQAGSRVLILSNYGWYNDGSGGSWTNAGTSRLFQNGSALAAFTEHNGTVTGEAAAWQNVCNYTTNALTVGTYIFEVKHSRTIGGSHTCMRDGRMGTITLMEILA